jgi:glutamate:Na+ symporter, ESS family
MTAPFPFELMVSFGILSVLLLTGVFFRARLAIFQKFLFPASLIGALLGFALANTGVWPIDRELIQAFAYHLFNISFISVGLTPPEFQPAKGSKEGEILRGSIWMASLQAVTFSLQALVGAGIVFISIFLGRELFPTFGFLLPLAFNEGPGQALSIGKAWETLGFTDASTIGLTLATLGFFFAFFVGVPLANAGIRKRDYGRNPPDRFVLSGILPRGQERPSAGGLTTHNANVECLAFHIAQIGLVYLLTYAFVRLLTAVVPSDVAPILWGFFFLFGLVAAIGVRILVQATPVHHLLDAPLQRRITGWSIDYLIVATGCAIELLVIRQYMLPILGMALLGGVVTTLVVLRLGNRLAEYRLERTMAIYGVVTGTVSSGLLLLRIVDPELKSPAAREIGFMNVFAVPVIGGLTFFLNVPLWWGWSLFSTSLVLMGVFLVSFALLFNRRLWRRRVEAGEEP